MRLRLALIGLLACAVGAFIILPVWAQSETYQYIDIRNPFLRKIPLAVPLFKNSAAGSREDENSRKAPPGGICKKSLPDSDDESERAGHCIIGRSEIMM